MVLTTTGPLHKNLQSMTDKCVTAHTGAKKYETIVNDRFSIKQPLGEGRKDFFARFNDVRMTYQMCLRGW